MISSRVSALSIPAAQAEYTFSQNEQFIWHHRFIQCGLNSTDRIILPNSSSWVWINCLLKTKECWTRCIRLVSQQDSETTCPSVRMCAMVFTYGISCLPLLETVGIICFLIHPNLSFSFGIFTGILWRCKTQCHIGNSRDTRARESSTEVQISLREPGVYGNKHAEAAAFNYTKVSKTERKHFEQHMRCYPSVWLLFLVLYYQREEKVHCYFSIWLMVWKQYLTITLWGVI